MTRRRVAGLLFLSTALGVGCVHPATQRPPAPQLPTSRTRILPIDEAEWQGTEFKGVEAAVLWGDPEHDARGGELLKMAGGLAFPRHKHTYDERVLVIAGVFIVTTPTAGERSLRPGSYYYLPAEIEHASRCETGVACVVYSEVIPVAGSRRP